MLRRAPAAPNLNGQSRLDSVNIDRKTVAALDIDPAATHSNTAIPRASKGPQIGCVAHGVG